MHVLKSFWSALVQSPWTQMHLDCVMMHDTAALLAFRGFTAAVLSKPAEAIEQRHPRLVSAAQLLFTPVLQFPPIANRQSQVRRMYGKWDYCVEQPFCR